MTTLLHISASPRGAASESLQIANTFLETYRETHPGAEVETLLVLSSARARFARMLRTSRSGRQS